MHSRVLFAMGCALPTSPRQLGSAAWNVFWVNYRT